MYLHGYAFTVTSLTTEEFTPKVYYDKDIIRDKLTDIQYHITQQKGTEEKNSGMYYNSFKKGKYKCILCGEDLFSS